jgi:hypothetical protein
MALAIAAVALAAAGCTKASIGGDTTGTTTVTLPGSSTSSAGAAITSSSPPTTTNPTGASKVFAMGATGHITESGQEVVDVIVSSPQINTNPTDLGDGPKNGYFATFTIQATDVSKNQTFDLNSADFYIQGATSGAHYDELAGNAYEAQGQNELPLTTMNPGQVVTGTVTFDEPYQHGWLVYAPGLSALGAWTF